MLDELASRVAELKRNRQALDAFVSELTEEQWQLPLGQERYSARQTVAHLAGADKSMTRMAQNWIAGVNNQIRPDFDLNYFNARQQEKRAHLTNDELVADWHAAQNALIAFFEEVKQEDLDKRGDHPRARNIPLRRLFEIVTEHEAEHIQQLVDGFQV